MAVSFTGAHFCRDASDNTSLYLVLYGGTDVPAENEYDTTGTYTSISTEFKFAYPGSVNSPTYDGISNVNYAGSWSWNSDRTEVTIPMYWGQITNDDLENQVKTLTNAYLSFYTQSGSDATDWKQVDKIDQGYFMSYGGDGISINFYSGPDLVDQWTSWDGNTGANGDPTHVNTYDDGYMQIFNSPVGTSGRKNVYDTGGFVYNNISTSCSTGGASGDPHITTFGGCRYTL